jgi:hypothetical protein
LPNDDINIFANGRSPFLFAAQTPFGVVGLRNQKRFAETALAIMFQTPFGEVGLRNHPISTLAMSGFAGCVFPEVESS